MMNTRGRRDKEKKKKIRKMKMVGEVEKEGERKVGRKEGEERRDTGVGRYNVQKEKYG